MKKTMTDKQLAAARKIFTEFVQKKQNVLKNLDQNLNKIFKDYKKELEKIEKEENSFDVEEALKAV